jgi:uncharacterized protein (UPF0548 family)
MQYLWFGQEPSLTAWESRDFWPGSERGADPRCNQDVYEQRIGLEAQGEPEPDGLHRRAATEILGYRIFPPRLVTGVLRREPLEAGDTVGIVFRFVPGLRLFFAARVVETFDRQQGALWRTGFTYRTLVGHPEYGAETFCVEKDTTTGAVTVALRSWSRPGTWLARLTSPFVRSMQIRASKAALEHLSEAARGS